MTTLMPAVCCAPCRRLHLSVPFLSTRHSSGSRRRILLTPCAARPLDVLRRKNCSFLFINVPRGRSIRTSRVFAYLPDLENSNDGPVMEDISSMVGSVRGSSSILQSDSYTQGNIDSRRGKSGSVSFCGLTHQMLEERKLIASPFKDGTGTIVWVLGPLALISSLVFPQFFLSAFIESVLGDEILAEIIASLSSEFIFYAGLAAFLSIADHVQLPYLDFSSKRWSLITGLRGYLSFAFFTMGFKVFAPLLAAYVIWPVIGLPAIVAITPFLLGCAAQYAFEIHLANCNSSCWPALPIIFEVYRLYQLNKGAHFVERLLFLMKDSSTNSAMERSSALISMLAVFQILGVVCLWSLATFLLRLYPSRPVAENY
ncbi:uncharacterized protein LOC122050262 [Zingiber officinale]|uniref:Uncharacterized protein n=1 Tax=Zingiber officinale TaxID=94328 RepID=A0A8J5LUP0_ZINOF|nr:uncharacterized protein LOC122050262 [Zingiber officinale]XP_042467123.1 uncharacterized protein LOC122050262 [Zingiber officinale]KAG6531312.1 hypothetical protein ZIOFF_005117 [Zingiber officinale]